ncbi:transcription factor TFIID complex subunit A/SAGA complex subunit [Schizosaccharomyces japonicus yFS275]|uniref:TBP-associated factor 12 n=1 Tax=Schizosaccharomyces japonicus (strain yFS275 / FY16936) TaxID=402676 RepID=B6K2I7_SCHJY|nr:transcription factor TFIID complex subunit A/SAGA complex subunit [Schizosaccharomyces japonicus yFS275]EEB07368.2 transcription factor TFIID complex subunit A/SAGA complex subunit [Schizosaccharomyces japonicus yFS275]
MNGNHSVPGTPVQRAANGQVSAQQYNQQRTNQFTSLLSTMSMYQQLAQNVGINTPQGRVYLLHAQTIRQQLQAQAQSGQLPNQQILQQLQANAGLAQRGAVPEQTATRSRPPLTPQEHTLLIARHRQLQTAQTYLNEMKEKLARIKHELATNDSLDAVTKDALMKQEAELVTKITQYTAAIANGIRSIQQIQNKQFAHETKPGTADGHEAAGAAGGASAGSSHEAASAAHASSVGASSGMAESSVSPGNAAAMAHLGAAQKAAMASGMDKPGQPGSMAAAAAVNGKMELKSPTPFSLPPGRATLTGGYASGSIGLSTPGLARAPHYELDSGTRLLSKRKLQELLQQIDPDERLEPDVEELLLEVADEFVETVTSFACRLAKHRKSDTLDVKDVQLHLERNWNIRLPGYASDDVVKSVRKTGPTGSYQQKQSAVATAKSLNKD